MKQRLRRLVQLLTRAYQGILRIESHYAFSVRTYRETILRAELERDPKLITPYGWSGYSQNDEDGILQEIYRRIGSTNRRFLEFGAGDPLYNTGTYLLLSGWSGQWVEVVPAHAADIRGTFQPWIQSGNLIVTEQYMTPENINESTQHLPADLDLLVIDIDGNDYHVWQALTGIRPRVVMVEYNATFRPPIAVVQPCVNAAWDGGNFWGASLQAFEYMAREKGYLLVGCNITGTNAFFVRQDVAGDHFSAPYTAEHHYREQWIEMMAHGYTRQFRSSGPGFRYDVVAPPDKMNHAS